MTRNGVESLRIGVIMDPVERVNTKKDSTYAMIVEAARRGHRLWYLQQPGLSLHGNEALGHAQALHIGEDPWYRLGEPALMPLADFDVLLMRKDPPIDAAYFFATQILDFAERDGVLVVNRPQALRDASEKLFACHFPDLIPKTLVSSRADQLRAFVDNEGVAVLKPLGGMGGASIFLARREDKNLSVILETLLDTGEPVMAQEFLEEIDQGDKRILLVDGQIVPYALARIPSQHDFRGNLARGGRGEGRELSDADWAIAQRLAPTMRAMGILFAGLDVIGDRLTEVNVTSPTCIRELDALYGLNIAGQMFDAIEARCG